MAISGVASPEETSAQQGNQPQQHRSSAPRHDASISALLNDKQTQKLQYQQEQQQQNHHEDYLPTPVTPATSFPILPPSSSSSSSSFSRPIEASVSPLPSTHATKTMMAKVNPISSPEEHPTSSIHYQKQHQQQQQGQRQTSTEKTPLTPSVDKPYACTHCNQTFSRPHNLKSHLTTHSSERPFQCDICKNYFRRHHDLKRHRKLHTGERPYSCNVCHRSFARLDALNRHCRAEGGTACSSVHRVQGRRTIASITSSKTTTTTTTTTASSTSHSSNNSQRPIIPQLHIAHPATQPFANEVYPYPPTNNSITPHPIATSNASTFTTTTTTTNTATTSMTNDNNNQQCDPAASMRTPATSPQPLSTHSTSNITASCQSTSSASSSSSSSSSSSAKRVRDHLLPSPSALSRLPVSESRDLVPIQKLQTEIMDPERTTTGSAYEASASSPHPPSSAAHPPLPPPPPSSSIALATATTTPPPNPQHHSTPPPYYGWISTSPGRDDRTLPLPNRYPGNSNGNYGNNNVTSSGERGGEPSWERLRHENHELRQELAYWQTSAEELNTLKSRLHDLQVENKVLRSLITESSSSDEQHNQTKRKLLPCQMKEEETAYKRRNMSNI